MEDFSTRRQVRSRRYDSVTTRASEERLDPDRYSVIAHRDRDFMSPISAEHVDDLIDLLHLPADGHVLEVGCGKGELVMRVLMRYPVQGEGWDISVSLIKEAHRRATQRGLLPFRLRLRTGDEKDRPLDRESLDLAICVGSCHIYGGFSRALETLSAAVRSGGFILVGEPFWKRKPKAVQVKRFGMRPQDYGDLAETVVSGENLGLIPLSATISSDDERDAYEWDLIRAVEDWAVDNPGDPDREGFLARAHRMRDSYLAWRRDSMGFGLFLYRVG